MKPQFRALHRMRKILLASIAVIVTGASLAFPQQPKSQKQKPATEANNAPEWPQFGGPQRNFKAEVKSLAASWPESGPRQLWRRALGEGHSAILVDNGKLYTMYSDGDREIVIALDAATGKTIWEHTYEAPKKGLDLEYGSGPHATPLIVGDLLYTAGATAKLHALNKQTGKVVWFHDLWKEFGGTEMDRGYSCNPLAYNNKMRVHFGTAIRAGDYIYGSSGDFGPCFFTAIAANTGEILWQDRGLSRASFLYADGKFIILDEDGNLALATVAPEGLKVDAKVALLSNKAWTAPTLVGNKLYARDRKEIVALEL